MKPVRDLGLTMPVQRMKVAKPTVLLTWRRLKCVFVSFLRYIPTNGTAKAELNVDPFLQPDDPRTVAEGALYTMCVVRFLMPLVRYHRSIRPYIYLWRLKLPARCH
jgi:hypothetical protein